MDIKEINEANVNVFKNTVKKAVEMMKNGGVDAKIEEENFDWGTEYRILVNKSEENK